MVEEVLTLYRLKWPQGLGWSRIGLMTEGWVQLCSRSNIGKMWVGGMVKHCSGSVVVSVCFTHCVLCLCLTNHGWVKAEHEFHLRIKIVCVCVLYLV